MSVLRASPIVAPASMIITSPEGSPTRQAEPGAAPRAQSRHPCAHDNHRDLDVSAVRDGTDHDGPPESEPSRFGPPPPRWGGCEPIEVVVCLTLKHRTDATSIF